MLHPTSSLAFSDIVHGFSHHCWTLCQCTNITITLHIQCAQYMHTCTYLPIHEINHLIKIFGKEAGYCYWIQTIPRFLNSFQGLYTYPLTLKTHMINISLHPDCSWLPSNHECITGIEIAFCNITLLQLWPSCLRRWLIWTWNWLSSTAEATQIPIKWLM